MTETRTVLGKRPVQLRMRRLSPSATLPDDVVDFSRGLTLCADLGHPLRLSPTQTELVTTGLSVAIPTGYSGMILSRKGLSQKHSVSVLDAPTLISPTFTGEVRVVLHNHGRKPFTVYHGAEIAQLLVVPIPEINLFLEDDYHVHDPDMQ